MLDLYDEFKGVIAALNGSEIDYAVCGGLAMAVYGLPRATVDIDLLITGDDFERVKQAVRLLGYTIEAQPMTFAKGAVEIRRLSKAGIDTSDSLMLDCFLVTPQIEETWYSRTESEWEEGTLPIVSRGGLVALKSLRANAQDIQDIVHLHGEPEVDTSAKVVTVQLKRVSQLRRLCLSLAKAKPINPPAESNEKPPAR